MKKSVYIFGMVCLSIVLMGTIFKAMHIPGAAILLFVGLISMALLFIPFATNQLAKKTNDPLLKFVYYAASISFSIDFIGALFKILHWPGANWFMIIGVPLPFILFLPAYLIYHNKRKLKSDLSFFGILLFMIYLGVFSAMLAINVSQSIYGSYIQSTQSLSETNKFLKLELPECIEKNRSTSAIQIAANIELMKQKLIIASEPETKDLVFKNEFINYSIIRAKDKTLSQQVFNDAGLELLNLQLKAFYKIHEGKNENTNRLIKEIEVYRLPRLENEAPLITYLPLIAVINVLTDWQNKLLLIEYTQNQNIKYES